MPKLFTTSLFAIVLSMGCATDSASKGETKTPSASVLRIVVPSADKDAGLWIDGNYVGQLGEFDDERVGLPRLAPGVHRIEVRKPGRFPVQRSVEVPTKAPSETVIEAELLPDPR